MKPIVTFGEVLGRLAPEGVLRSRQATDVESGELSVEQYPAVAREIVRQFPNISKVAITLRESHSASHNNWGARSIV